MGCERATRTKGRSRSSGLRFLTLTSTSTHTVTVTTSETQERARTARKLGDGPRRAGLLDTAALCFGELGYDAVTVETITTRADVSRATFYAYFSSKDEVFRAVAEMMCGRFLDAQHMEGPAAEDLREVLRTTTSAFITAVYTYGDLLAVIEHRARVDSEVESSWSAVREKLVSRYVRFVERIRQVHDVDPCVSPPVLVQMISDAQMAGGARLSKASADEQNQFIADMTTMSERLIGFEESK